MKTMTYLFEENKKQSSGLGHLVDVAHRTAPVAKTSIGSGQTLGSAARGASAGHKVR
jgi:hypothetical protein